MGFLNSIFENQQIMLKTAVVILYCIAASLIVINRKRFEKIQKQKNSHVPYFAYVIAGTIAVWSFGRLWTMYIIPTTNENEITFLGTGIAGTVLSFYTDVMFIYIFYTFFKERKQQKKIAPKN